MNPLVILLIGVAAVLVFILVLRLHAVLSLLLAALITGLLTSPELIYEYGLHAGMSAEAAQSLAGTTVGKRLAGAFGNTSGKIGILIAMASIIGTCLLRSGAAERIIRSLLAVFGKRNPSLAFLTGSFTLAIPIFFDTVFYLMMPLVKSVGIRNPRQFALSLMAVTASAAMAHSLIPPTPGPLFVAEEMGVDLGAMIIGGLAVGIITVGAGYLYALWASRKWDLPVRDTPDIKVEELKRFAAKDSSELPGLTLSLLPILLPLVLIAGNTFLTAAFADETTRSATQSNLLSFFQTIGDSNIALTISALVALWLLWSQEKNIDNFKKYITESLTAAGLIILITASGGAFGKMLQQTGIGIMISNAAAGYQTAILPLGFFIAALMRTAQGSATVAMITAIGILSGFGNGADLGFHPVYLALVIGCGSKVIPWMNDSGFWIVTQMSGMHEQETFRFFSILLTVMAFAGLIAIMILANVLPFA